MQEGSGVTNLQTELNYLDSFKSYFNSSDLGFLSSGGVGQVGGGCLGSPTIVYMSSGMFSGKESLNRIELSRLVQELLNFGDLGCLWLWGMGGGWMRVGGGWGGGGLLDEGGEWLGGTPHTCAHAHACTHAHVCTCMCGKHDNFMQMAAPIRGIPMMSYGHVHVHACTCVCMCVGDTLLPPPTPSTHPQPLRGDPRISQNAIELELIKIFEFCLKI